MLDWIMYKRKRRKTGRQSGLLEDESPKQEQNSTMQTHNQLKQLASETLQPSAAVHFFFLLKATFVDSMFQNICYHVVQWEAVLPQSTCNFEEQEDMPHAGELTGTEATPLSLRLTGTKSTPSSP